MDHTRSLGGPGWVLWTFCLWAKTTDLGFRDVHSDLEQREERSTTGHREAAGLLCGRRGGERAGELPMGAAEDRRARGRTP